MLVKDKAENADWAEPASECKKDVTVLVLQGAPHREDQAITGVPRCTVMQRAWYPHHTQTLCGSYHENGLGSKLRHNDVSKMAEWDLPSPTETSTKRDKKSLYDKSRNQLKGPRTPGKHETSYIKASRKFCGILFYHSPWHSAISSWGNSQLLASAEGGKAEKTRLLIQCSDSSEGATWGTGFKSRPVSDHWQDPASS